MHERKVFKKIIHECVLDIMLRLSPPSPNSGYERKVQVWGGLSYGGESENGSESDLSPSFTEVSEM